VNACSCTVEPRSETGDRRTPRELLQAAVAYAVLAPSTHNTQPWRFEIEGDALLLFADRTRGMPVADPGHRELLMSCGAALFNLRTALQEWGYAVRTELLPDDSRSDLLARVTIAAGRPSTMELRALVAAMGRRRTHRAPFADTPLPGWLLQELGVAADCEGAWLTALHGHELTRAAELVGAASRVQLRSGAFRRELATWLRPNATRRPDGIPGYAFGLGWLKAALAPFAVALFDVGRLQSRQDIGRARRAPALVVIGTEGDSRRDWLVAGQALQRILLTAAMRGVSASFLNAPVQVEQTRSELLALSARRGAPQVLLRLGYGGDVRATPRRVPSEVLCETA